VDELSKLEPRRPELRHRVARFTADYASNFDVTQDVNIVVNGIDFEDTGIVGNDATLSIRPVGGTVLTFDGTAPFVNSRSTTGGGAGINFYGTVDVGTVGLTKIGGGTINLSSTLTGSGTITLASGSMEVRGNNAATFTGEFVANGGSLELRGGNHRDNHFMLESGSSANATGTLSRTSEFILGATNTWGGYTHITANHAADGSGEYIGTLRLTNGNDRLPVTTTVILGGSTNSVGLVGCNGRLVLAGYNQKLAGLVTCGSGPSNQVVGGSATLSTLTLNITSGTTNVYAGALGGSGTNANNLALVLKGGGLLVLSGANTYTGATTVQAGTLAGTGALAGALTVEGGGAVSPGNGGIGTLSVASADLGGAFEVEIDRNGGTPLADRLAVSGSLTLGGSLTVANIGGALDIKKGDSFDLFNAGIVEGSFDTVNLPSLSTGLAWDTFRLNTDGIIAVVSTGTLIMLN